MSQKRIFQTSFLAGALLIIGVLVIKTDWFQDRFFEYMLGFTERKVEIGTVNRSDYGIYKLNVSLPFEARGWSIYRRPEGIEENNGLGKGEIWFQNTSKERLLFRVRNPYSRQEEARGKEILIDSGETMLLFSGDIGDFIADMSRESRGVWLPALLYVESEGKEIRGNLEFRISEDTEIYGVGSFYAYVPRDSI